jgi:hypothetical protein
MGVKVMEAASDQMGIGNPMRLPAGGSPLAAPSPTAPWSLPPAGSSTLSTSFNALAGGTAAHPWPAAPGGVWGGGTGAAPWGAGAAHPPGWWPSGASGGGAASAAGEIGGVPGSWYAGAGATGGAGAASSSSGGTAHGASYYAALAVEGPMSAPVTAAHVNKKAAFVQNNPTVSRIGSFFGRRLAQAHALLRRAA